MRALFLFFISIFVFQACKNDSVNPIVNNEYSYVFFHKSGSSQGNPKGIYRLSLDDSGDEILISQNAELFSRPRNGKLCYYKKTDSQDGIFLADIDGNNEELILKWKENPVLSPDGNMIAHASYHVSDTRSYRSLNIYDIETKNSVLVDTNYNWITYSLFSEDGKYLYYYSYLGSNMSEDMCLKVYDIEKKHSTVLIDKVSYSSYHYERVLLHDKKSGDVLFQGYNENLNSFGIRKENGDIITCLEANASMFSIYDSKLYYSVIENSDLPEKNIVRSIIKNYKTGNEDQISEFEDELEFYKDAYKYMTPINKGKELLCVREISENSVKSSGPCTWRWEKIDLKTKKITIFKDYGYNNKLSDGLFYRPTLTFLY